MIESLRLKLKSLKGSESSILNAFGYNSPSITIVGIIDMHYLTKALLAFMTLMPVFFTITSTHASAQSLNMTVYKSPHCGCCKDWNKHMISSGFKLTVIEQENMGPIKQKLGVEPRLASCHTATINGYLIEGHVPANDIKKLLRQKLDIKGLAVPGMVTGSPGMEDPSGEKFTPFQVVAFKSNGEKFIFSSHAMPLSH